MKDRIHKFSVMSQSPKNGDWPFTPYVEIVVDNYSTDQNGFIQISPQLMSDIEIDNQTDALIKDLERNRRMLKLELEKLQTRQKPSKNFVI